MKIFNILKALARPRRLHNWFNTHLSYNNRPTSADVPSDGYGGVRKFLATSDMVTNNPDGDGHIIQLDWDSPAHDWSSQLFIPNGNGQPQFREQLGYSDWANGTQWYTILSEKNTADFIVEQGTSGSWTYRKWKSGVSECWGKWSNNVTVNSTWGVLYEGKFSDPISYPSGLFLQTPTLIGSISGTAGFLELSGSGDNTKTGLIYIVRPYSSANSGYQVNLHAFGNYK